MKMKKQKAQKIYIVSFVTKENINNSQKSNKLILKTRKNVEVKDILFLLKKLLRLHKVQMMIKNASNWWINWCYKRKHQRT